MGHSTPALPGGFKGTYHFLVLVVQLLVLSQFMENWKNLSLSSSGSHVTNPNRQATIELAFCDNVTRDYILM